MLQSNESDFKQHFDKLFIIIMNADYMDYLLLKKYKVCITEIKLILICCCLSSLVYVRSSLNTGYSPIVDLKRLWCHTFAPHLHFWFLPLFRLSGRHVCRSHFHQPGSGTKHLPGCCYSAAHYSSLYSNWYVAWNTAHFKLTRCTVTYSTLVVHSHFIHAYCTYR